MIQNEDVIISKKFNLQKLLSLTENKLFDNNNFYRFFIVNTSYYL